MALMLRGDFIRDVRDEVARRLIDAWGIAADDGASASEVTAQWFALMHRMIEPRPRRVFRSRELSAQASTLAPHERMAIDDIDEALTKGIDVNHRLSKAMFRKDDHDRFLNDLGFTHLHLGKAIDAKGFIARTDSLLFALVQRDVAYLLDVHPHKGAFDRDSLLQLLDRNWPQILDAHVLHGVSVDEDDALDESDRRLRRRGFTTAFRRADGTVIGSPGGGQVISGLSLHARTQADWILNTAAEVNRRCRSRIALIHAALLHARSDFCSHELVLRYELVGDDLGYAVTEMQSGFSLQRWLIVPATMWRLTPGMRRKRAPSAQSVLYRTRHQDSDERDE